MTKSNRQQLLLVAMQMTAGVYCFSTGGNLPVRSSIGPTHTNHRSLEGRNKIPLTVNFAEIIGDDEPVSGVEVVSLAGLGDDHESVGEDMAKSVAAWLDAEWMPQEVHVRMGTSVKNTYVQCRRHGIDDVSAIMTQVTDDLYARWKEYDADAFVNAWDVGNYVADYLIAKSGSETCGCSSQIYP